MDCALQQKPTLDRDEVKRLRGSGLTITAIAQHLGTAEHNIRSALYRVRKTYRPLMNYDPSEVVKLRLAGVGKKEIAERLGISVSVVTKVLGQNKVVVRVQHRLTKPEIKEIITLRKSGLEITEIADRVKMRLNTVHGVLKRNGVTVATLRRELKDQVAALYLKGASINDIATQINRTAHQVGSILIERGLRQRQAAPRSYIPFPVARDEVRKLKLTSKRHWYAYVHDHKETLIAKGIRLHPHHYKEFAGFADFLGLGA